MMQEFRETEREKVFDEYNAKIGEVATGIVQRTEMGNVYINIGKLEALLPKQEQVPTEPYRFNDRIKVYLLEVRKSTRGPQVIVSRSHPSLIRRLFELEVPEIADGSVLIKSVAREAGARSKIAVASEDDKIDPVGACVGHRGARVQAVVSELYDEKIDIVRWSADVKQFVAESLSPAKSVQVRVNEEKKSCFVLVPDNMLSLAIGKSGQNVRLAARLTGWRIDIRSESQEVKAAFTVRRKKWKLRSAKRLFPPARCWPATTPWCCRRGAAMTQSLTAMKSPSPPICSKPWTLTTRIKATITEQGCLYDTFTSDLKYIAEKTFS